MHSCASFVTPAEGKKQPRGCLHWWMSSCSPCFRSLSIRRHPRVVCNVEWCDYHASTHVMGSNANLHERHITVAQRCHRVWTSSGPLAFPLHARGVREAQGTAQAIQRHLDFQSRVSPVNHNGAKGFKNINHWPVCGDEMTHVQPMLSLFSSFTFISSLSLSLSHQVPWRLRLLVTGTCVSRWTRPSVTPALAPPLERCNATHSPAPPGKTALLADPPYLIP